MKSVVEIKVITTDTCANTLTLELWALSISYPRQRYFLKILSIGTRLEQDIGEEFKNKQGRHSPMS